MSAYIDMQYIFSNFISASLQKRYFFARQSRPRRHTPEISLKLLHGRNKCIRILTDQA